MSGREGQAAEAEDERYVVDVDVPVPPEVWDRVVNEYNDGEVPDDPNDVQKWILEHVELELHWKVREQ